MTMREQQRNQEMKAAAASQDPGMAASMKEGGEVVANAV
jgi:hypothetical protein